MTPFRKFYLSCLAFSASLGLWQIPSSAVRFGQRYRRTADRAPVEPLRPGAGLVGACHVESQAGQGEVLGR